MSGEMDFWRSDESEDNYSSSDNDKEKKKNSPRPFLKGKHFHIQPYASNYRGRIKILRLVFIADRYGDGNERRKTMQLDALQIAYDEAKKGKDVDLFTKIVEKIKGRLGRNYCMDESWRDKMTEERNVMSEMLKRCAKQCENSYEERKISAEEARNSFNSVAKFFHVHGAATIAYRFYKKSIRFCKTNGDFSELLSRVILSVIEMGQFELLAKIAEKGLRNSKLNSITVQSLRCALGLAYFKAQRYKDAAHQFLGISKELGNRSSEVMAAHDIAAYGGLCALATFEQAEFQTSVMDNENFQSYLDLCIEVKQLVRDFYLRRYASCFKHLDNLREWLILDIYFFNDFERLYDQIKTKALILYIEPFVAVGLQRLAVVFGTSIEAIEKELTTLINTNKIEANVDSIQKVLHLQKCKEVQLCSIIEWDHILVHVEGLLNS